LFEDGKTATETFQLIKQVSGDNALPRTRVFEWYARFRDGRENIENDESSGRPTAVRTPDMIETVRELISTDRRMMEEELEISRETIGSKNSSSKNQFHERGSWFLLHDNARPHAEVPMKQFLAKQGIPEINYPLILPIYPNQTFSYSPKLNPR
jgi:hypothetical protein